MKPPEEVYKNLAFDYKNQVHELKSLLASKDQKIHRLKQSLVKLMGDSSEEIERLNKLRLLDDNEISKWRTSNNNLKAENERLIDDLGKAKELLKDVIENVDFVSGDETISKILEFLKENKQSKK